jgi:hypothetical protein
MGIWVILVVVSVGVSGQAAAQAAAACQCQKVIQMVRRAEPADRPVSLVSRLVQNLEQMYCAQTCLLQETTFERMQPYEEARQRAAAALQETVSHLDLVALQHLLTAEEATYVKTFKQAFAAFLRRSSAVASKALLPESPTERAAARELAAGQGQGGFEQADTALQKLVTRLGGAELSAEAIKAELGFPSVGTTWKTKLVLHTEHTQGTLTKSYTVLAEGNYEGRPVHRVSDGVKLILYDKATGNWTADVRAGVELKVASPYVATYAFPLWVGKIWQSTFTYEDHERDRSFSDVPWLGRVSAYEDVTVRAGTFKAFKVEGTDVYGVRRIV